jgi:DTW domain-containing protein YfiP
LTHIAAASPAVMLALVAEIERLRNKLDDLECQNCGNQPKFCMCEVEQPEASNADQA